MSTAEPAASPPPTSPGPAAERTRNRFVARVLGFLGEPARRRRLALSTILAGAYVGLVLVYARGHLLYGLDYPGIYSAQDFLYRPIPDWLLPSIGTGVGFGNPYFGFYFSLAVGAFVATYGCQLFAREVFARSFRESHLLLLQGLAATFYLFGPVTIVASYKSLVQIVLLSSGAFFLILTLLVRLARRLSLGWTFRPYDALLLGVGVGLSAPDSFPNQIRVLGFALVATIVIIVFAAVLRRQPQHRAALRRALRSLGLVTVPVAVLLLAYILYSIETQWLSNPAAVRTVAAAYVPLFSNTTYNTLPFVARLLGRRSFPSLKYAPAYTLNPLVTFSSLLWPLLAIVGALVTAYYFRPKARRWVYLLVALSLLGIAWDTGANPPFGGFNEAILRAIPVMRVVLPTYSVTFMFLAKFFPVLIAYVIVVSAVALPIRFRKWWNAGAPTKAPDSAAGSGAPSGGPAPPRAWSPGGAVRRRRPDPLAVAIVVVASGLVLVTGFPVFTGSVEGSGVRKGYVIPSDYFQVRSILQGHHANAVLLPGLAVYFSTRWGFQGANSFYIVFNYPSQVVVPGYWGPYAYLLPATQQRYANLTSPIEPNPLFHTFYADVNATGTATPRGGVSYEYHLPGPVNVSAYQWIRLSFPQANVSGVLQMVRAGQLKLGIHSNDTGGTGYYYPGSGFNALVNTTSGRGISFDLLVGTPSSSRRYDVGNVTSFLAIEKVNGTQARVALGPASFSVISNSVLRPGWTSLLSANHVQYLLIDTTIVHGAVETHKYVVITLGVLEIAGVLRPVFAGPNLQLYQVV
ncbi:MAG TPA: hypothetical protein VFF67_02195 [Thermoplasmata archaeon]|nr:hypothetical protein [Thermoplasmata archaeon]